MPILGADQWTYIEDVVASLDPDVEALAIMTPTPIASMDPDGQAQRLFGDRTDDVEKFKRGNAEGVLELKSGREQHRSRSRSPTCTSRGSPGCR